jgi:hypothetical protein
MLATSPNCGFSAPGLGPYAQLLASIAIPETSFSLSEIAPQEKLKTNEAFSYQ